MYDMKNLTKLKKLGELAPDAFKGFVAFDEALRRFGRSMYVSSLSGSAMPGRPYNLIAASAALWYRHAGVAELADAPALGAGAGNGLGVRVPPPAYIP